MRKVHQNLVASTSHKLQHSIVKFLDRLDPLSSFNFKIHPFSLSVGLYNLRWDVWSHIFNKIFSHNVMNIKASLKLRILLPVFLSPVNKHLETTLSSEVIA